jgi:hypothetical protein
MALGRLVPTSCLRLKAKCCALAGITRCELRVWSDLVAMDVLGVPRHPGTVPDPVAADVAGT